MCALSMSYFDFILFNQKRIRMTRGQIHMRPVIIPVYPVIKTALASKPILDAKSSVSVYMTALIGRSSLL